MHHPLTPLSHRKADCEIGRGTPPLQHHRTRTLNVPKVMQENECCPSFIADFCCRAPPGKIVLSASLADLRFAPFTAALCSPLILLSIADLCCIHPLSV